MIEHCPLILNYLGGTNIWQGLVLKNSSFEKIQDIEERFHGLNFCFGIIDLALTEDNFMDCGSM